MDRSAEARSTASDVYADFTDGFDTADLKGTKALLDQLSKQAARRDGASLSARHDRIARRWRRGGIPR
ncbi:MAG TPA: hypothetical protein VLL57_07380 [Candidatus Binataceae bacterium]|nr:hypothetical protein [Candidatus Binataceae bacterium]